MMRLNLPEMSYVNRRDFLVGTQNIVRWSGLALVLAGLIYVIFQPLHPADADPGAALNPLWAIVHYLIAVHHLLVVVGLVGVYLVQAEQAGRLGLIGFVAALLANAYWVGGAIDEALFYPYLAAQQATPTPPLELFDLAGPLGAYLLLILAALVVWDLGTILLGLAIVRAGVLPRWGGLLLIVGNVVLNVGGFIPGFHVIRITGGVIMGIAYAWLGYTLWTATGERQPLTKAAM